MVIARESLASASYDFGRFGTISAAYVERTFRGQTSNTIVGVGYTLNLGRWGYVGVSASRVRAEDRTAEFNALWTVPFGAFENASYGYDHLRNSSGNDHSQQSIEVQRNLPLGEGYGYRLSAVTNGPRQAEFDYQNSFGTYAVQVGQSQGQTSERVAASGGIGFIANNLFLSRAVQDSFGLVRLPGYPGVRVYSENQVIGRTDAKGELVVPRLLPYQKNTLRIEQADLPFDVEFDVLSHDAVPYFRSGVVVEFTARSVRGALVKILQEDDAPVPTGALVRLEGQQGTFPVALDGDAYLTDLIPRNRATVTWRGRTCSFEFAYPETGDAQPRLGPFVCRRIN